MGSPPMKDAFERVAGLSDSIIDSDEQLNKYIRANIGTYCHASGTAPIGPDGDANAVLDQKCNVRGIEKPLRRRRLRLPSHTECNTQFGGNDAGRARFGLAQSRASLIIKDPM